MENAYLLLQLGIVNRWRLQAIPQCLVIELDFPAGIPGGLLASHIPVVNEVLQLILHRTPPSISVSNMHLMLEFRGCAFSTKASS
jgi:hypothetical protein